MWLRQVHGELLEALGLVGGAVARGELDAARAHWRDFVLVLARWLAAEAELLFPLLTATGGPGDRARLDDEHARVGALAARGGRELDAADGDGVTDTLQQLMLVLYRHTVYEQQLAASRVDARLPLDERRRLLAELVRRAAPPEARLSLREGS